MVLLLSIAAIATKSVIDFTSERFLIPGYERDVHEFSLIIWSLTIGFMFLSGALGLLAISATAEYESRHRIAGIVNTMHYLSDGLLALEYNGRIRGANPAVRRIVPGYPLGDRHAALAGLFPSLTEEDLKHLLNRQSPSEVEVACRHPSGLRMFRIRSQPGGGMILAFISDITEMRAESKRRQQFAKLQLLGRIAGGVAHDFSNILSAISGNAVLMQRFADDRRALNDSIEVIISQTQRGARLSRQLVDLSRSSDVDDQPSGNLADNINEVVELLRVALSSRWTINAETAGNFPPVPLSATQIVQILLNLGLLAADALKNPGQIGLYLSLPDAHSRDLSRYAAVVTLSASAVAANGHYIMESQQKDSQSAAVAMVDTTGVITSVVRALIEDAGGRLDDIYISSVKRIYRVCLPFAETIGQTDRFKLKKAVSKDDSRFKQWKILLACSDPRLDRLEKMLADAGADVVIKHAMDAVLAVIDGDPKPDVLIADKRIFGAEADSLLKAIRKVCPHSGIIIISRKTNDERLRKENNFLFLNPDDPENVWMNLVAESKP